jgi:hypothetical protein
MIPRRAPRAHEAVSLLLSLALLALGGCTRRPARRASAAPPPPALPALELPALAPQQALPARRVLQLFHSSNVAAELEPCG